MVLVYITKIVFVSALEAFIYHHSFATHTHNTEWCVLCIVFRFSCANRSHFIMCIRTFSLLFSRVSFCLINETVAQTNLAARNQLWHDTSALHFLVCFDFSFRLWFDPTFGHRLCNIYIVLLLLGMYTHLLRQGIIQPRRIEPDVNIKK